MSLESLPKPCPRIWKKLDQYNVFEEVGDFLDGIPNLLRRKTVVEYKKFLYLKYRAKDTKIPAKLSPSELIGKSNF